ncbi:hypothetical protein [Cytobacillus massiliigabonensis]|uniref:hypothetical protein n=1 Tax=Cytobacillus massiliigabonensis TaxID=1871011 RepID=UPI0015E100CD|nr:hypothetical protein [Cytobacillus massiliigabonensis]
MKKSRRERRAIARKNKTTFVPQYNGKSPQSYKEYYGVGYERFNNTFVTIAK